MTKIIRKWSKNRHFFRKKMNGHGENRFEKNGKNVEFSRVPRSDLAILVGFSGFWKIRMYSLAILEIIALLYVTGAGVFALLFSSLTLWCFST